MFRFDLLFKYMNVLMQVAMNLEGLATEIAGGQPAVTPAVATYLEGKHVNVTVHIDPIA